MAPDARIGTDLAGYRIEEAVARGGMGVVYRAEQVRLGRKVALKVLAPELAENIGFRTRFEHEMRLAAAIDHPNIIPLYEAGEADGVLFLTMRYIEGSDLKRKIATGGALEPAEALTIVGQVASALDAAHARGLVHRDIKPGNVLIASGAGPESSDHCYLTDFGLTKDTSSSVELTATGTFVGTIDYVAPEQIEGLPPDGRSDQYSLAAVLYECLVGHPPFVRDAEVAVMWAHLQDPPPSVSAERPQLPAELDEVIAKAMAKSPEDRYASCGAFVAAARRAVGTTVSAPPAPAPARAPADATRISGRPETAPPPLAVPAPGDVTRPAATTRPADAPDAEPAAPARGRRALGPALAVGAVLVAVAAVAGVLAGGSSSKSSDVKQSTVAAGPVALRYGAAWRPGGDTSAIPGLELKDATALQSGAATLVAGTIAKPGPALLPTAVGRPASSDAVTLGSTAAFRHVLPGGGTVYVVPTSSGPLAIGCIGPASARCDDVAATVTLHGAQAQDIRPSSDYATALTALTARVQRDARAPLAALGSAATSKAQARPARRLAGVYRRAVAAATKLEPPAPAALVNRAIATTLGGIAGGYRRLATAAAAHHTGAYSAARQSVRRGQARLADLRHDLTAIGYRVQS